MKKLFIGMFYMFMICGLCACTNNNNQCNEDIKLGKYIIQKTDEIGIMPNLVLLYDNRFTFYYSVLSSYISSGSYQIKDSKLILVDDAENDKVTTTYVFKIEGKKLIFKQNQSTALPNFASNEMYDGAVFVYVEDVSNKK
ncbi:hypothetical protein PV797_10200 [Clostridiaceae bacterium M8S5]|nr:hypothetical protein PV797_10200 [Clostridiaceae bacterium M8S5]